MEREYNWKAILTGAIPVSIVMAFIFYTNITRGLKYFYLILSLLAAIGITYYMDKKKHNIFTAPFIVIIVALIVHALKNLGFI
jgi:hypothetical protein